MSGEKLTVLFISALFQTHPLASPSLSERGGIMCPATSYTLSIIERGIRGELRKAKKTCQLWSFSPVIKKSDTGDNAELLFTA
jgi:hypothetical protein